MKFLPTTITILGLLAIHFSALPRAGGQEYFWTTLAGQPGGPGLLDGAGSMARFDGPAGMAVDSSGNIYVTEPELGSVRKISPGGVVTTLPGLQYPGEEDYFFKPVGVALDGAGNVYVAGENTNFAGSYMIRKITPSGVVSAFANRTGGNAAGFGPIPSMATDHSGNLYVADPSNSTIHKITPGGVVKTLAGLHGSYGSADGTGGAARFRFPNGVGVAGDGSIYVADSGNLTIRKITSGGTVSTFAGKAQASGNTNGAGSSARFNSPQRVAADAGGNVYVTDWDQFSLTEGYAIRKITPARVVTTLAGSDDGYGYADGMGSAARFKTPGGLAVDAGGNVYVADNGNYVIRKVTSTGAVSTLAGRAIRVGSADGPGAAASFDWPRGIGSDGNGNVYVADYINCTIRRITRDGVVTTIAGRARQSGSVDGHGDAARFNFPRNVAVDSNGVVYVTDGGGSSDGLIRKITPLGDVTTLSNEMGNRFVFDGPYGVTVDSNGVVYVIDSTFIRKITPEGRMTTLAGDTVFSNLTGITVDQAGNVFVSDYFNNDILKITPDGVVSALAIPDDYTNHYYPEGVTVDHQGNVYVTHGSSNHIDKITPSGEVSIIGGSPLIRGDTDGADGAARFYEPRELTVDGNGILYVTETGNRIRKGTPVALLSAIERWRLLHFGIIGDSGGAANDLDFDHDGLVNLLEWATGSNPKTPNPSPLSLNWSGSSLELTYPVSISASNAGAVLAVEWNDGLSGTWSTDGISAVVDSDDGTLRHMKATLLTAAGGRRFFRLRVTAP